MSINDNSFDGLWWLPTNPIMKIPGTIIYGANGSITLQIIGSVQDLKKIFINDYEDIVHRSKSIDLIIGRTSSDNITLYKCLVTRLKISSSKVYTIYIGASYAFSGHRFMSIDSIKFKSLYVYYPYLFLWAGGSGFGKDIKEIFDRDSATIHYKKPEPIILGTIDGFKISINNKHIMNPQMPIEGLEWTIKQEPFVKIESKSEQKFSNFDSILFTLQNFLSLAYLQPVVPYHMEGESKNFTKRIGNKTYKNMLISIYKYSIDNKNEQKIPNIFFRYGDISNNAENYLKNFIDKSNKLEPIYKLYFGILNNPNLYTENKFLNLAQAIESYHRRTMNNNVCPIEEYNAMGDILISSVPTKYVYWALESLKYGNEPSPAQRLAEIIRKYKRSINKDNINDAFISKVVSTRNYLTHYDESLKDKAVKGNELELITAQLEILLRVCILEELGFAKQEIVKLFIKNQDYGVFKKTQQ